MSFQDDPNTIQWRLHLKSPIEKVYQALSTDSGRASFWAESAIERDDSIPGDRTEVIAGWVSVLMSLKVVPKGNCFGENHLYTLER